MNDAAIEMRNLVRQYGTKAAVDGVTLRIPPGGVVALVGPNGAGKTTLLHLLLGLLEPTEGTAEVLGHASRRLPAAVAARVQAVGDRNEPYDYLHIEQLLALQAEASREFDQKLANQLLFERDLAPAARFGTLSKGQRRWVLATLALASRPRALLMDEPADGLDPTARQSLYQYLRRYVNQQEATALVASHVLSDLERVADEVIVLRGGRVVLYESLETLREQMRELHLTDGEAAPEWLERFEIVAERDDGVSRQQWIRLRTEEPGAMADVWDQVDRHPHAHHVNLESLYHALTQADRPVEERTIHAAEVTSCQ